MPKKKRKSDSENVAEESNNRSKTKRGKGLRTGVATLAICAAAFGAYYSPHFRAASSDWLKRGRSFVAKFSSTALFPEENVATEGDKTGELLAQAPSFRDFLTDEYGEEGARELLGIDATSPSASAFAETENGDFAVAASNAWKSAEAREVASNVGTPFPSSAPTAGFADYVAAESTLPESLEAQAMGTGVVALLNSPIPEPNLSFADYVAAESNAPESATAQGVASGANDLVAEFDSSVPDDAASKAAVDFESTDLSLDVENERLALETDAGETALAARLQEEMKERGVGNPRIERWGERFWRASGFATTEDGVATFCEAVDVDPTAAQRAALAKFEAANF